MCEDMMESTQKNNECFVDWISWNLKTSVCDIPIPGTRTGSVLIANTTAFAQVFRRIEQSFTQMYTKREFVHSYIDEGMEMVRFDEARSALIDLIQEYEMYNTVAVELQYEDEDEVDHNEAGDEDQDQEKVGESREAA
jgi:tubulin beta